MNSEGKHSDGANLKGGNENLVTCTKVDEQSGFSTKKTLLGKVFIALLYNWKGFHGRLFF